MLTLRMLNAFGVRYCVELAFHTMGLIVACAKVEGAEIHWGYESGLRSDDV